MWMWMWMCGTRLALESVGARGGVMGGREHCASSHVRPGVCGNIGCGSVPGNAICLIVQLHRVPEGDGHADAAAKRFYCRCQAAQRDRVGNGIGSDAVERNASDFDPRRSHLLPAASGMAPRGIPRSCWIATAP